MNDSLAVVRRPWWRERRIVFAAIAIAVVVVAALFWRACHKSEGADEAAVVVSVEEGKAQRGTMSNDITTVATLAAIREATLSPKIAAPIAQMPLLTNRVVRQGDVLAVLESRDVAAQRAEAAAAVQEAETSAHETVNGAVPLTNAQDRKNIRDAQAALDNARKTLDRRQALYRDGGISKKELEASELAVVNAEDDLRVAESSISVHRGVTNPGDARVAEAKTREARERLVNLDAQLGYTVIRAPFSGVVTGQFQYQGEVATPGTKMLTIADASSLIAKTQVAAETAALLKPGDKVTVIPDELQGQTIAGTVSLIGRGADPQSRSVEVWVTVPNPSSRLRPNGVARVVIAAQTVNDAVIVPTSAVTLGATNGNTGTVMVVDDKSVAHEVHVTVGLRSGGRMQITSGLRGGETIVTAGNYGLPDGTKVSVASPATAAPAAEPAEK